MEPGLSAGRILERIKIQMECEYVPDVFCAMMPSMWVKIGED
jgi:hypothetical protein